MQAAIVCAWSLKDGRASRRGALHDVIASVMARRKEVVESGAHVESGETCTVFGEAAASRSCSDPDAEYDRWPEEAAR